MTSARPLFFVVATLVLLMAAFVASGFGEDGATADSASSVQKQLAAKPDLLAPAKTWPESSELFFLTSSPRLDLSAPAVQPQSTAPNDNLCLTMRTYKVKRKERFADGESGSRGYSTCEMAKNFEVRSAVAHPQDEHSQLNHPGK